MHKIEARDCYCSSDHARPDIAICSNFELDILLAHPWCSDVISNAAWLNGAAIFKTQGVD